MQIAFQQEPMGNQNYFALLCYYFAELNVPETNYVRI